MRLTLRQVLYATVVVVIGALIVLPVVLERVSSPASKINKPTVSTSRVLSVPHPTLDTSKFTNDAYVIPLGQFSTASAYSSTAQLRGIVQAWRPQTLLFNVAGDIKEVLIPDSVRLWCTPAQLRDAQGKAIAAKDVWVDLGRVGNVGSLIDASRLPDKFPAGSDLTVLVSVATGDKMTAELVVGFGCEESNK